MVKLDEVCEILDSKRIPITASERNKGIYPYYGANGIQDYVNDYIFDDELVLLAEDGGNFGSKEKPIAFRVSGKSWVNNHAHVLKPKENIDVDYLCYSLMYFDVTKLINGSTRQKLTQSAMREIKIPFVEMKEQQHIVKVLDTISEIIEKRKQQIAKLDELEKSLFIEMFGNPVTNPMGWEIMQLSTLGNKDDVVKCGPFGTQLSKNEYCESGIPIYGIPQVSSSFKKPPFAYITEEKGKELSAYSLKDGDIVMSRKGTIGKCALYQKNYQSGIIHSDLLRIRVDETRVNPIFLTHQLHSSQNVKSQVDTISNGAIMKGINVTKLSNIHVMVPPIVLQREYASKVEHIFSINNLYNQSQIKMQEEYNALMQQYFG